MLNELVKNYPGVTDAQLNSKEQYAVVRFDTKEQAKLALSGLNHFKIDQMGTELRVSPSE